MKTVVFLPLRFMKASLLCFAPQKEEERRKQLQQEKEQYRLNLWAFIAKKEIPKVCVCVREGGREGGCRVNEGV